MRWLRRDPAPRQAYLGEVLGEYRSRSLAPYRRTPMPGRFALFVNAALNVVIVGGYFLFLGVLIALMFLTGR